MKFANILAILLLTCSCGNRQAVKTGSARPLIPVTVCKIPRATSGSVALGIPKVEGLAPSVGVVNMAVLFVDFDDVPATQTVDSVFSIINPIAPDFFKETSYGRMELNLQPHYKWLRLSKMSDYYATAIYKGQPHLDFIQEAVDLADEQVDFSQTHIVLVLTNPKAKALRQGPTFKSTDPTYHIKADGASIPTGITSGYDLNHWGGIWLAHETGHSLSLPDLYHFGSDNLNRYVGTFGLMGTCDAKAPGYFAFERWMLGWLDDTQIFCHDSGDAIVDLTAIEKIGGTKALIVPVDSTTALVVESRRKIGFDRNMTKEGALAYVINTSLRGGNGPIQVKPGVEKGNNLLEDAPMAAGDTYSFQNISIKVLESSAAGDKIQVQVQ
ncbi:MAG: hypothetical protein F6K19_25050 [Cyanothece sp. SIO1E1]|nr:hypothetical protein [Cyanothece sp. SIO1E1]